MDPFALVSETAELGNGVPLQVHGSSPLDPLSGVSPSPSPSAASSLGLSRRGSKGGPTVLAGGPFAGFPALASAGSNANLQAEHGEAPEAGPGPKGGVGGRPPATLPQRPVSPSGSSAHHLHRIPSSAHRFVASHSSAPPPSLAGGRGGGGGSGGAHPTASRSDLSGSGGRGTASPFSQSADGSYGDALGLAGDGDANARVRAQGARKEGSSSATWGREVGSASGSSDRLHRAKGALSSSSLSAAGAQGGQGGAPTFGQVPEALSHEGKVNGPGDANGNGFDGGAMAPRSPSPLAPAAAAAAQSPPPSSASSPSSSSSDAGHAISIGLINAAAGVPSLVAYAAIVFQDPVYESRLDLLCKFFFLSSAVHQLVFCAFSTLPFAIGQVQDVGLIFLSAMASSIAILCSEAGYNEAEALGTSLVAMSIATAVVGASTIVVARKHWASIVQYVPLPVIGGYLGFVGYFCIAAGSALAAGTSIESPLDWFGAFASVSRVERMLCMAASCALLMLAAAKAKSALALPGTLLGIVLLFHLGRVLVGASLEDAMDGGWVLRPAKGSQRFWDLWKLFHLVDPTTGAFSFDGIYWRAVFLQMGKVVGLILVVCFGSCMDVAAIQQDVPEKLDFDRELTTVGISNVVVSVLGCGYTGSYIFSQTIFTMRSGVRSRLNGLVVAGIELAMFFLPFPVVQYMPNFFFGALLCWFGIEISLDWLVHTRRLLTGIEYALLWLTFAAVMKWGLEGGIAAGIVLATLYFAYAYARSQVSGFGPAAGGSDVIRTADQARALDALADHVATTYLNGFVFFGSAHAIATELEAVVDDLVQGNASSGLVVQRAWERGEGNADAEGGGKGGRASNDQGVERAPALHSHNAHTQFATSLGNAPAGERAATALRARDGLGETASARGSALPLALAPAADLVATPAPAFAAAASVPSLDRAPLLTSLSSTRHSMPGSSYRPELVGSLPAHAALFPSGPALRGAAPPRSSSADEDASLPTSSPRTPPAGGVRGGIMAGLRALRRRDQRGVTGPPPREGAPRPLGERSAGDAATRASNDAEAARASVTTPLLSEPFAIDEENEEKDAARGSKARGATTGDGDASDPARPLDAPPAPLPPSLSRLPSASPGALSSSLPPTSPAPLAAAAAALSRTTTHLGPMPSPSPAPDEARALAAASAASPRFLIVDFSAVRGVDATAARALTALLAGLQGRGVVGVVTGVDDDARRMFEAHGLGFWNPLDERMLSICGGAANKAGAAGNARPTEAGEDPPTGARGSLPGTQAPVVSVPIAQTRETASVTAATASSGTPSAPPPPSSTCVEPSSLPGALPPEALTSVSSFAPSPLNAAYPFHWGQLPPEDHVASFGSLQEGVRYAEDRLLAASVSAGLCAPPTARRDLADALRAHLTALPILPPSQAPALARTLLATGALEERHLAPSEPLWAAGDSAEAAHLVLRGALHVQEAKAEHEAKRRGIALAYDLGPGCVAGVTDYLLARPHATSALAGARGVTILTASHASLAKLAQEHPTALLAFETLLTRANTLDLTLAAERASLARGV